MSKLYWLLFLFFVFAGLTVCPGHGYEAEVIKVYDGDTLTVKDEKGKHKIRLARVDAPELKQKHGKESRDFVRDLTLGGLVDVQVRSIDCYKREVAEIFLDDGRCLNDWLVLEGMAWWYHQYAPGDTLLKQYQEHAVRHGLGLWADHYIQEPWEYRREQRKKKEKTGAQEGRRSRYWWTIQALKFSACTKQPDKALARLSPR